MRVVVTGATGNVGTSVLAALGRDPRVEAIVGLARRTPQVRFAKTSWVAADVSNDDLAEHLRGADAVIHLAWLIQPSRDPAAMHAVNVEGTARVFHAAAAAGVRTLVHASSVGVYSPGPDGHRVDESWATNGIDSSTYSRHKVEAERLLDRFELGNEGVRVARLRPGLIFKREAAAEIRRYFAGPLLPGSLVRAGLIPVVPDLEQLHFQAVHSDDVGAAYALAATNPDAHGPYNIAAEPVIDGRVIAGLLRARRVRVPRSAVRRLAEVTWKLRLQPTDASWLDLALDSPLMDTTRAREHLGWEPRHSGADALAELLAGLRDGAGAQTPPLDRDAGGPLRLRELLTGIGGRSH